MSSRIMQVALCSGDAVGERLVPWRTWDCFLCLYKKVTMYPLDRAMSPIRMASLIASSVEKMCLTRSLMGKREQDSVMCVRFSEVELGVAMMYVMR